MMPVQHPPSPRSSNPTPDAYATLAHLLVRWWDRHGFDRLLEQYEPDDVVERVLTTTLKGGTHVKKHQQ
jgi:hypothetical protein